MKTYLITTVALVLLTGFASCTQLSPEDRKLLTETHDMAQQARDQSIQATEIAKEAQASAAQSAIAAQAAQASANTAASKAERIYNAGQNK